MRHENGKGQQKDNHIGKKDQLSAEEKKRLGLDRPITRRDFMIAMANGLGISGRQDTTALLHPGQRFGRIAFAHTDLNGFADNQGTTRISR